MIQRIPKPIRIAITVLLSLVIIFGIAFLIFSHTPTYFRLRYPSIDDRMSEYPTITAKVPSDFVSRTKHGITIKAPSDCVNPKESNIAPFKSDYLSILVMSDSESDLYDDSDEFFSQAQYEHFFNSIGEEMPETWYDDLVFLRNNLTSETCRGLHGTDFRIYKLMAKSKDLVSKVETPYFYQGDNFDGLICVLNKTNTNVVICDPVHQQYATVMISCEDEKLKRQIIASIDVSRFMAGDTD